MFGYSKFLLYLCKINPKRAQKGLVRKYNIVSVEK